MNLKKRVGIIVITLIIGFNCIGCLKNKNVGSQNEINLCVDLQDKDTMSIVNLIRNEYEKENSKYKISIENVDNNEQLIDNLNKDNIDILFTNRNNMIRLARKGFIADLSKINEENKINERYYEILNYYGNYNNEQYGIGLLPFSIEIMCNKKALGEMKLKEPKDIEELYNVLKEINKQGKKVPVIIPEDLDAYNLLFSSIVNNLAYVDNIDQYYDSKDKYYKLSNNMQKVFSYLNTLQKDNVLNENTLQRISAEEFTDINKNKTPLIVCALGGKNSLKDEELDQYKVLDFKGSQIKNTVTQKPIICVTSESVDKDDVKKFIKFIYSDEFQRKLVEKGFYSNNISVNKDMNENYDKSILNHITYANKRNMYFQYNIPQKLNKNIKQEIIKVLSAKHNGIEWRDIVKRSYK